MTIKNKILTGFAAGLMLFGTTSCSDWLAVDLEDSIMETKLFESNEGYLTALNGVYAKLNENYASTLSMGAIDVMAQYYDVSKNSSHSYYSFATYAPTQYRSVSNTLWTTQYSCIANLNMIIDKCDRGSDALTKVYYPYVKGEALAMRAFLHFDLLRLYGPIYSDATADKETIPYEETTSKDIQPLLSAKEIMAKVLRDLNDAAELLTVDRIRTDGVMNGEADDPNESTNLRYRQYRMNYYTVQALLARAYLWMGDKEKAYSVAKAIIDENKEKAVFPWTAKGAVQASSNPDRIFSTEVMFALYNTSRNNLFDQMFNRSASISTILSFSGNSLEEGDAESKLTYFYDDMGDLRRENMWSVQEVNKVDQSGATEGQQVVLCFHKYEGVTNGRYRYMIPLVRMSEVYLIAAECATDEAEALGYINELRAARNCVKHADDVLQTKTIQQCVTDEFMREVIGEGQLFFYYKRLGMTSILAGNGFEEDWWGDVETQKSMVLGDYVWPMPDVETNKRLNANK